MRHQGLKVCEIDGFEQMIVNAGGAIVPGRSLCHGTAPQSTRPEPGRSRSSWATSRPGPWARAKSSTVAFRPPAASVGNDGGIGPQWPNPPSWAGDAGYLPMGETAANLEGESLRRHRSGVSQSSTDALRQGGGRSMARPELAPAARGHPGPSSASRGPSVSVDTSLASHGGASFFRAIPLFHISSLLVPFRPEPYKIQILAGKRIHALPG